MKTILVTGASGFIGRHVVEALGRRPDVKIVKYDRSASPDSQDAAIRDAEVIFHLAGVNRPEDPEDFATGNAEFTRRICDTLRGANRRPLIVLTSSIQAALYNPYGQSKRAAEDLVEAWAEASGGAAVIFRLRNVFGKWCRPNYNSVVATFCHNIAHDLPISISDPARALELVYIDDVTEALIRTIDEPAAQGCARRDVEPVYRVTLGGLAEEIQAFRQSRTSLVLPSFATEFTRRLYATYLSYLAGPQFGYALEQKTDPRGSLAEFMKSASFGQIFVSRTKPGITRGNHYHHTKTEKFLVVEGEAVIRFRHVERAEVIEHRVSGAEFRVVDIPPGYVHSIENVGPGELVTLFWASEIFDPKRPDCYFTNVLPTPATA